MEDNNTPLSYDELEADLPDRTTSFDFGKNWARIAWEYLEKEQYWETEMRALKRQLWKYKIGFYLWPIIFIIIIFLVKKG